MTERVQSNGSEQHVRFTTLVDSVANFYKSENMEDMHIGNVIRAGKALAQSMHASEFTSSVFGVSLFTAIAQYHPFIQENETTGIWWTGWKASVFAMVNEQKMHHLHRGSGVLYIEEAVRFAQQLGDQLYLQQHVDEKKIKREFRVINAFEKLGLLFQGSRMRDYLKMITDTLENDIDQYH